AVRAADLAAVVLTKQIARAPVVLVPEGGGTLVAQTLRGRHAVDDIGEEQRSVGDHQGFPRNRSILAHPPTNGNVPERTLLALLLMRENQDRITELVRAVVRRFQRRLGPSEHVVALKRAQHLMVALLR